VERSYHGLIHYSL